MRTDLDQTVMKVRELLTYAKDSIGPLDKDDFIKIDEMIGSFFPNKNLSKSDEAAFNTMAGMVCQATHSYQGNVINFLMFLMFFLQRLESAEHNEIPSYKNIKMGHNLG